MRRRRNKGNKLKIASASLVLVASTAGAGYLMYQSLDTRVADQYGCFSRIDQRHTVMLIDASEPRWNEEQARSLERYFEQTYNSLAFNERLSVYTTEGDMVGSILTPRFHVCGQANSPEQLKAINAQVGNAGYLEKKRQHLYERILNPQVSALLDSDIEESRRQAKQSPILEQISDLSRIDNIRSGTRLIVISDFIQNSDTAQFCQVQNDMPPFYAFEKREDYQSRLKPKSLSGVSVEALMLQRDSYGPFCRDEEEIKRFWKDYFQANDVKNSEFIRIRTGGKV